MQKPSLAATLLAAILTTTPLPVLAAPAENTAVESTAILSETTSAVTAGDASARAAWNDPKAPSTAGPVAMPNPLVPYASYDEMCAVLGFRPLILPKSSGYELKEAFVIGGTTSDMRYAARYGLPEQRAKFTVRTARKDAFKGGDTATIASALSGIYSVSWQPCTQDGMQLLLAEVSPTGFAACWTQGDYIFSCEGQGLNRWDFLYNVASNLLDLTAHYYTNVGTAD